MPDCFSLTPLLQIFLVYYLCLLSQFPTCTISINVREIKINSSWLNSTAAALVSDPSQEPVAILLRKQDHFVGALWLIPLQTGHSGGLVCGKWGTIDLGGYGELVIHLRLQGESNLPGPDWFIPSQQRPVSPNCHQQGFLQVKFSCFTVPPYKLFLISKHFDSASVGSYGSVPCVSLGLEVHG